MKNNFTAGNWKVTNNQRVFLVRYDSNNAFCNLHNLPNVFAATNPAISTTNLVAPDNRNWSSMNLNACASQ